MKNVLNLGVDWVLQNGEIVVSTSVVGTVFNGLSQLIGVSSRPQFCIALIHGLGGNLTQSSRKEFARQVYVLIFASKLTFLVIHNQLCFNIHC